MNFTLTHDGIAVAVSPVEDLMSLTENSAIW